MKNFYRQLRWTSLLWMMFVSSSVFAQEKAVTGTVTDDSGDALPGVNVIVKGTITGTATDADGNYRISVPDNDALLVYTSVGYMTTEVAVGARSVIDVQLEVDLQTLSEIVVVGYTSQSKERVTGAISQVNTEEALAVPIINAGQALQGRASGVHVIGSGQPGSTPLIRVRGFGTTNDNGPLYVIDGMQTTDASVLSQINPNDIEAINVLKDASAAIYGARASNGVIIVTTKSGVRGEKPVVSFSSYIGFQQVGKTQKLLNSQQLGDVLWESFRNDGVTPTHPQYGDGPTAVIPAFIRGTDALPYDLETNKITRGANPGTNWLDEIFRTAPMQNYDLSVQGGGAKSRYLMSVGYQNIEGVQRHTGFERFATRLNTEFDANDNIRFGEHLSVGYTDQLSQNQLGVAQSTPPLVPVYDEGGNFGGSGPSTAVGLSNTNNPVAQLIRGKDNFDRSLRVIGDAYIEVGFLNDFTAKSSIGINYDHRFVNDISRKNPEAPEPKGNDMTESNARGTSWVWSNTLRWDKEIGNHNLQLLAGVEAVSEDFRITETRVQNFLLEDKDFFILGAGTGTPSIIDSRWENSTLFSYFFNANYAFKNKYLATISIRRDKTSRFAEGNNTGVFPSGSVGWILSEENFMQSIAPVSFLKLRASYGLLGNQDIPVPNPDVNILVAQQEVGFYPINGTAVSTGAILASLGNPDLQWETSKQFNVGFDLGLFDNDLNFSVDYFNNTTQDMIVANPLPSTSIDANAAFINAGEVNNKGFDFTLSYGNTSKQTLFKWDVGLNLSAYKNELVKINEDNPDAFLSGSVFRSGVITRSSSGQPISYYFGRDVIGIFQNAAEVAAAPDQGFASAEAGVGRFRYRDVDGNGVINDNDRVNLGDPHPDFTYGINANFTYNKFFLTLFLQGVQGNEVYHFVKIGTDFPQFLNSNRSVRVLDSWSETNPDAILPALSTSIRNNETQPNSYFVEDGSYMRLRNLQFGYNFNIPKLNIQNAQVYLQGTNLFTLTDYLGADPEMGTGNAGDDPNPPADDLTIGVDTGRYPVAKSYILGLKFSF